MRAFVALDLPEAMLDGLERLQDGLPGRAVVRPNLHLTLAFLGDVGEAALRDLWEALEGERLEVPVLRVEALDVFGGRRPDLVFAAVAGNTALEAAARAVRRAAREAGIAPGRERFRPHVTLVRFRGLGPKEEAALAARLGPVALPEGRAEALSLYRSELRPEGARYEVLASRGFAGLA